MQTFETLPPPVEGTNVPMEEPATEPPRGSESRRGRRSWIIGLGVLGVVIAAALAVVAFLMLRPVAEISATSFDVPDVIMAGDDINVVVGLTNGGGADGDHEVVLLVDGVEARTEMVAVASGTDENTEFSLAGRSPGTYEFTLEGQEDVGATVWVVAPPQVDLPAVIAIGDEGEVSVTVANQGSLDVGRELAVLVVEQEGTGETADREAIRVEPGATETFSLPIEPADPGTYDVSVALGDQEIGAGSLWVMVPPSVEVPDTIVAGEDLVVDVLMRNDGSAVVDHELSVTARADGTAPIVQRYPIELSPSTEETISAEFTGLAAGLYDLELRVADWQAPAGTVKVLAPAEFETSAIETPPSTIDLVTTPEVTLVVDVTNVGDLTGSVVLQASLDGTVVEERNIELAGGASATETFVFTITTPGPHEVSVGDTVAAIEAYQIQRPDNGTVIFNEIGGGSNELTIVNNNADDVFVVLAEPGEGMPPLLEVYVHGGSSHTVYGIRRGTYEQYYSFGSAWCTFHRVFTEDATYGRFEDASNFDSSSTTYTEITLTFGATDGWSPTEPVPEDSFPGR
jgi:hypothetical protein